MSKNKDINRHVYNHETDVNVDELWSNVQKEIFPKKRNKRIFWLFPFLISGFCLTFLIVYFGTDSAHDKEYIAEVNPTEKIQKETNSIITNKSEEALELKQNNKPQQLSTTTTQASKRKTSNNKIQQPVPSTSNQRGKYLESNINDVSDLAIVDELAYNNRGKDQILNSQSQMINPSVNLMTATDKREDINDDIKVNDNNNQIHKSEDRSDNSRLNINVPSLKKFLDLSNDKLILSDENHYPSAPPLIAIHNDYPRWQLALLLGGGLFSSEVSGSSTNVISKIDQTITPIDFFSGQGFLSYNFQNNLFIETGILYTKFYEKINVNEKYIEDIDGNFVGNAGTNNLGEETFDYQNNDYLTEISIKGEAYNRQQFIDVPLRLGIRRSVGNFRMHFASGIVFNILADQSGYTYNQDLLLTPIPNANTSTFNIGYISEVGVSYPIRPNVQLSSTATVARRKFQFELSEHAYNSIGIHAGIVFRL